MSNKGNSSPSQVSGWQATAQSAQADQNRISCQNPWVALPGNAYTSHLVDPDNYSDAASPLELHWRIATGSSHADWLIAHAGMLKRIAHRLSTCLAPPKYLALPAPKTRAQLEHKIYFDWLPELKDGCIIFEVRLQLGDRENAFNIGIDPKRLQDSDHKLLQTILTRRLTKAEDIYSHVSWLLEVALSQQGLGKNAPLPLTLYYSAIRSLSKNDISKSEERNFFVKPA